MMVEFREYGFIKWKFENMNFLEFSSIFWWLFKKVEEVSINVSVRLFELFEAQKAHKLKSWQYCVFGWAQNATF